MERGGNVYEEFNKILLRNYSPERLCLMDEAANRMFVDLDDAQADLEWAERNSDSNVPFDFEDMDWDFPDPPNFSRWDCI